MSSSARSYLIFGYVLGSDESVPWTFEQVVEDTYGKQPDPSKLPWLKTERPTWMEADEGGYVIEDFQRDANNKLAEVWGEQDEFPDKVKVDIYGYLDGYAWHAIRCVEFRANCSEPQRLKLHQLADPTILAVYESRVMAAMSILGLTMPKGERPGWHMVTEYG